MLCARVFSSRCHAGDMSVYGGSLDSTTAAIPQGHIDEQENVLSCITGPCPSKRARRNVKKTTKVRCTIATKTGGHSVYSRASSRRPLSAVNHHGNRKLKEPNVVASCWPTTKDTSCSLGVGLKALSPWRQQVFKQTIPIDNLGSSQYSQTGSLINLSLASRASVSRVGRLGIRGEVKLDIMATTDGRIKVQVCEAKDLRHSGERSEPVVYTEVSVCRGSTCLRSYVTNILEASHPVFNESLHVDIEGCDDHRARIVIGIVELRTNGRVMIGCMSFGVRHLKRKAVSGWYYILNDELGKRKHLRSKNTPTHAMSPNLCASLDQAKGHRYQKKAKSLHPQTGAYGTPRKNVLERVAIYNRQRRNAGHRDAAFEKNAIGRYDSTGQMMPVVSSIGRRISNRHLANMASKQELMSGLVQRTASSQSLSQPDYQSLLSPNTLEVTTSLRDRSIPMTLADLQVEKKNSGFGCNAHGTVNQLDKSTNKHTSSSSLAPPAPVGYNIQSKKHRAFLSGHQTDLDSYLQDRLISLLYQEREFYDSATQSSSASSTDHQSDYDSYDDIASRTTVATTSDSERRWECLAAFDNFSGARSTTGSEFSSATDLHSDESDGESSLEESEEWKKLVLQLEQERQEYMEAATLKHIQSLRRLHTMGYISTPKPEIVILSRESDC